MPIDLTDVGTFTTPIVAPLGTDSADRTYVLTIAQGLANRTRYLHNLLPNGAILGPRALACPDGVAVRVVGGAPLFLGGTLYTLPTATAGQPELEGGGTYDAHAWYYLYTYAAAGALALQLSLSPPDPGTWWKDSSGQTHRFLGVVRALGIGTLAPFEMANGVYEYRVGVIGSEPPALTGGTAAAWTSVDLSAFVPPHVGQVRLRAQLVTTGAESKWVELVTGGDGAIIGSFPATLPTHTFEPPTPSGASRGSWEFSAVARHDPVSVPARTIDYRWADASGGAAPAGGSAFRLDVFGFTDKG